MLCDAVLSCASVLPSSVAFLRTLASKEEEPQHEQSVSQEVDNRKHEFFERGKPPP